LLDVAGREKELTREAHDDAGASDADGDGDDGGVFARGFGLAIDGEAGDDVARRGDGGSGAQAVLQGVAAGDGFPGGGARSGGAEGVAPAGGDLGCGTHIGFGPGE
jgi:hypothetical protein